MGVIRRVTANPEALDTVEYGIEGEPYGRFEVTESGACSWGPGTADYDTFLSRSAAGVLSGSFGDVVNVVAATGATQTIPAPASYGANLYTLDESCTFTMPTAVAGASFLCGIVQGTGGSKTPTFTGAKWPGGTAPSWSAAAAALDVIGFVCFSVALGWDGFLLGLDVK